MDISQAVRQAIAAGKISQTTLDELGGSVPNATDTRALAILADAMTNNLVAVVGV